MESRLASNNSFCASTSCAALAVERANAIGYSTLLAPSLSDIKRASRILSATYWLLTISSEALAWVSSSVSNGCPASTTSPSRTKMSATIPPSRCCTTLLYDLTVTVPGANAAPSRGAIADHKPKRPKIRKKIDRPIFFGSSIDERPSMVNSLLVSEFFTILGITHPQV